MRTDKYPPGVSPGSMREAERLADELKRENDEKHDQLSRWIGDVEATVNKARRTHGASDNLVSAVPPEKRYLLEISEALGIKDPVMSLTLSLYVKNYRDLRMEQISPTRGGVNEIFKRIDLIEKAWGYDPRVTKSLSEGTSTQGGFTVATPVEAEIFRKIRDNTVVRPLATKILMAGPTVQLPGEGSNVTAYIIPESTVITESVQTTASQFIQTPLIAKKFGGFATVTNELFEDNIIGLQDYLFTAIAEHIGVLEDQAALDGSTSFTGLDRATGVNSFSTATTGTDLGDVPTYAELIRAVYFAQESASRQSGRFFMHPYAFKNLVSLVDTTGQPIFSFGNVPGSIPYMLGGFPVELVSSLSRTLAYKTSSTNIYYGPPSRIVFGDIAGMMQFDIDPFSLFQKVLTNVRVIKRTGIAIAVPSSFTVLHGVKSA